LKRSVGGGDGGVVVVVVGDLGGSVNEKARIEF
jgi:hypothetical protein